MRSPVTRDPSGRGRGPETAEPSEGGAGRWLILAGVWLIYFCFGVVIAAMGPLIGPITRDLGIGNAAMGAILGAWPFVYIAAAVPGGLLLDRLGARRMLFVATLVMAASSFLRGVAETPVQLLLAVALFGLGGPLISVGAPKVIAALFTGPARATAMGIYVTGPYIGNLLSLSLTNSVTLPLAGGDWRGVMWIYAGLLGASGLVWLLLSAFAGSARAWNDSGGRKFDLRVFTELLRVPDVRIILLMSIGIFFINHALNNWLPEILRSRGMSPVDAGFWAAIPAAVGVAGALIVPRLAVPRRRLAVLAALFCATFCASLLLHLGPGLLLGTGLFVQGIARGAMMTVAILLLMETPGVPPERLGLAGGMFFTAAEVGGVMGPLTFGVLSGLGGSFTLPLLSLTAISLVLLALLARLRAMQR